MAGNSRKTGLMDGALNKAQETSTLTGPQEAAILLLLAGKSQKQAAQEAGVAEETVSRWLNGDPIFVAELNRRKRELWEANRDRLRALHSKAVDVIEELLEAEDGATRLRAAVAILKNQALPSGPTDPEMVELVWQRAKPSQLDRLMAGVE